MRYAARLDRKVGAALGAVVLVGGVTALGLTVGHPGGPTSTASEAAVHDGALRAALPGGGFSAAGSGASVLASGSSTGAGTASAASGGGGAAVGSVGVASSGSGTAAGPGAPLPSAISTAELTGPKVIETASVDLRVGRSGINDAVTRLGDLAQADGGFVSHSTTQSGDGTPSANLTLRIPDAQYAAAIDSIRGLGKVTSMTSSGDDVTSQYVDLQSQITALQGSQHQYLTILAKASSIGDILAVQAQLDSVDSQLQQLEGQENVLADQTTYATISVSVLAAGVPARPQPQPQVGLALAWHRAVAGFGSGVDALVTAAGPLLFVLLLLSGLWALYRGGRVLIARRRSPTAPPVATA